MKAERLFAFGLAAFALAASAFEARQIFREERFSRGNVNLRPLQPADGADWIWIDDSGPAKGEMDAVRFSCAFAASGEPLEIDVSADERFIDKKGRLDINKCDLLCYAHGAYFGLTEPLGTFGFSVRKKPLKKRNK